MIEDAIDREVFANSPAEPAVLRFFVGINCLHAERRQPRLRSLKYFMRLAEIGDSYAPSLDRLRRMSSIVDRTRAVGGTITEGKLS